MTLQDKIKLAIEQNRIPGAKKLASELISKEHKLAFDKAKQEEYDTLYIDTIEYSETQQDDEGNDVEVTKTKQELKPDSPIYSDWLNETRVVSEVVHMTYEEYVTNEQAKYEGMEDIPLLEEDEYNLLPSVKTSEVTELVRLYTPLEVTDELVESYPAVAEKLVQIAKEKVTNELEGLVIEHNTVAYDANGKAIGNMAAVLGVANFRYSQMVASGIAVADAYQVVYKDTTIGWKTANNSISTVQVESVAEALEKSMNELATIIGAK